VDSRRRLDAWADRYSVATACDSSKPVAMYLRDGERVKLRAGLAALAGFEVIQSRRRRRVVIGRVQCRVASVLLRPGENRRATAQSVYHCQQ
jgi:hypothetical protein